MAVRKVKPELVNAVIDGTMGRVNLGRFREEQLIYFMALLSSAEKVIREYVQQQRWGKNNGSRR